ncbi:MAG: glycosyltransferase family 39 protein, partial [Pseudomonadota bacterium]
MVSGLRSKIAGHAFWSDPDDRAWLRVLFAGLLALLALRLVALAVNGTDLFFDEAQYWYWSVDPAFGYYSKPPLIAWIIHLSTDVCGMSEFCIRLPSPLLHTATACGVAALGARLYDLRVGALSGLVFATLPAVSLSSGIISTDVPLLVFWAISLALFWAILEDDEKRWWLVVALGIALGFGLNAKYAMVWFLVCAAIYFVMSPHRRDSLWDGRFIVAVLIGLALLIPNVIWNAYNGFATVSHTADNANWGGMLFFPNKAAEFFLAQFGVFGPILFAALLVIAWRAMRQRLPEADRFLLAFALPIVVLITVQAFLSRAHANWAAVSYVSATVLVTATMSRDVAWGWLKGSLALHGFVLAVLIFGTTTAGTFAVPGGRDPFARTLGWEALADETRAQLKTARDNGVPFAAVLSNNRAVSSQLLYYLRDDPTPVFARRLRRRPRDHFELTRPFTGAEGKPVLFVSTFYPGAITDFQLLQELGEVEVPAGETETRRVYFYKLQYFKKTE